ncbi:hypothetical protein PspLS_11764 [Pyricularia sp. CBS 133598]|nr:hypothetical protein PspLS_11764 [Pyricularia sp. CBS 133598]
MSRPLLYHTPASPDGKTPDLGFGDSSRANQFPPISEAQTEALDALQFLGERSSDCTNFEKGRHAINKKSFALFHARDGYGDSKEKH